MKEIATEENNDDVVSTENVSTSQLECGDEKCYGQIFNDDHTVYSPQR
jgi:hypothetical protein